MWAGILNAQSQFRMILHGRAPESHPTEPTVVIDCIRLLYFVRQAFGLKLIVKWKLFHLLDIENWRATLAESHPEQSNCLNFSVHVWVVSIPSCLRDELMSLKGSFICHESCVFCETFSTCQTSERGALSPLKSPIGYIGQPNVVSHIRVFKLFVFVDLSIIHRVLIKLDLLWGN